MTIGSLSGNNIPVMSKLYNVNQNDFVEFVKNARTGIALIKDYRMKNKAFAVLMNNFDKKSYISEGEISDLFAEKIKQNFKYEAYSANNKNQSDEIPAKKPQENNAAKENNDTPTNQSTTIFQLTQDEKKMLKYIYGNTGYHSEEIRETLNIDTKNFFKFCDDLLVNGFIKKYEVSAGNRGRYIAIELIEKSYLLLNSTKPSYGKGGGFIHWWKAQRIKKHYEENGYSTEMEHFFKTGSAGKNVDLKIVKDGRVVFIEIENETDGFNICYK